jgi:hypothetical protein
MATKYARSIGMVPVVLCLALAAAHAQSQQDMPPVSPPELQSLIKPRSGIPGSPPGPSPESERGMGRLKTAPAAPFASGWVFKLGKASVWTTSNDVTFYIYCVNTDGSFFYDSEKSPALASAQAELKNACENPKGYYVFITGATWNQIWIPE